MGILGSYRIRKPRLQIFAFFDDVMNGIYVHNTAVTFF